MRSASKIKTGIYAWLLAMVVTLCLGETCVGAFLETPGTASGVFEAVSPEAIGGNYDASRYDASGYAVAPKSVAGSGPASGVLEVSDLVKSTKAFQNYKPGQAIEFVFDPKSNRFVVGKAAGRGSPHQNLAATIDADSSVVGGMFKRGSNGEILTNEFSGHYWQNWTPAARTQFQQHLERLSGQAVNHTPGM